MVHSLEDLKSGKLIGLKRLKLACGLTKFPEEILSLSETLEVLDLTGNQLEELPDSIAQLKYLKIIFASNNNFVKFPEVLGKLPELSMIGFKSNKIEVVPENAFPSKLRWLILTDNKIQKLPKSIGKAHLLQKCMLAGNLIQELPVEMQECKNLELLRISANKFKSLPKWLFRLPKLSWIAFGGNNIEKEASTSDDLESFDWNDFTSNEILGEGASGIITKGYWETSNKEVALKLFKGEVTSDGFPEDEMKASIKAGAHKQLIPILGKITAHPARKNGLIMELISSEYGNLGNPPTLETCTRDVFCKEISFSYKEIIKIAKGIASVCIQLHAKGVNHGDLYAHNILVNQNADCLLGDFGAASTYDANGALGNMIEKVEVRAFGCLLEDLVGLSKGENEDYNSLQNIVNDCMFPEVIDRPNFKSILERLS